MISAPSEKVVSIQRVGGSEVKFTLTTSDSAVRTYGPAKVVFHKYDNAYFLTVAWMPNSDHAQEFSLPANEIQVARSGGQDVVELAALAAK